MLFHIRDKARKPDGGRSCCHTCKQIRLVSRPQREKPRKRIASDIIGFTFVCTQLLDFFQCLCCPVSKFFCTIYSRCFPRRKFLIPRIHLCRDKRKWSFGHFLYLSDFLLYCGQIMLSHKLDQHMLCRLRTILIDCHIAYLTYPQPFLTGCSSPET